MESAGRLDVNHQLSVNELPYVVRWDDPVCTRCGRCTAVCPVKAIEPGVFEKRVVESTGPIYMVAEPGKSKIHSLNFRI